MKRVGGSGAPPSREKTCHVEKRVPQLRQDTVETRATAGTSRAGRAAWEAHVARLDWHHQVGEETAAGARAGRVPPLRDHAMDVGKKSAVIEEEFQERVVGRKYKKKKEKEKKEKGTGRRGRPKTKKMDATARESSEQGQRLVEMFGYGVASVTCPAIFRCEQLTLPVAEMTEEERRREREMVEEMEQRQREEQARLESKSKEQLVEMQAWEVHNREVQNSVMHAESGNQMKKKWTRSTRPVSAAQIVKAWKEELAARASGPPVRGEMESPPHAIPPLDSCSQQGGRAVQHSWRSLLIDGRRKRVPPTVPLFDVKEEMDVDAVSMEAGDGRSIGTVPNTQSHTFGVAKMDAVAEWMEEKRRQREEEDRIVADWARRQLERKEGEERRRVVVAEFGKEKTCGVEARRQAVQATLQVRVEEAAWGRAEQQEREKQRAAAAEERRMETAQRAIVWTMRFAEERQERMKKRREEKEQARMERRRELEEKRRKRREEKEQEKERRQKQREEKELEKERRQKRREEKKQEKKQEKEQKKRLQAEKKRVEREEKEREELRRREQEARYVADIGRRYAQLAQSKALAAESPSAQRVRVPLPIASSQSRRLPIAQWAQTQLAEQRAVVDSAMLAARANKARGNRKKTKKTRVRRKAAEVPDAYIEQLAEQGRRKWEEIGQNSGFGANTIRDHCKQIVIEEADLKLRCDVSPLSDEKPDVESVAVVLSDVKEEEKEEWTEQEKEKLWGESEVKREAREEQGSEW